MAPPAVPATLFTYQGTSTKQVLNFHNAFYKTCLYFHICSVISYYKHKSIHMCMCILHERSCIRFGTIWTVLTVLHVPHNNKPTRGRWLQIAPPWIILFCTIWKNKTYIRGHFTIIIKYIYTHVYMYMARLHHFYVPIDYNSVVVGLLCCVVC